MRTYANKKQSYEFLKYCYKNNLTITWIHNDYQGMRLKITKPIFDSLREEHFFNGTNTLHETDYEWWSVEGIGKIPISKWLTLNKEPVEINNEADYYKWLALRD